jgi:copper chaperone
MALLQLTVPSLTGAAGAEIVTKAVQSLDPNARVEVDAKAKLVMIETYQSAEVVKAAISNAGYPAI